MSGDPRIGTRRAVAGVFEINLRSISPITGLITALPVVAVFALGLATHDPRAAVFMGVGANLVAVVSLVGAPRLPLRLALLDALGLGVAVLAGTLTSTNPWAHTALLVPLAVVAGLAVVFGQTQAVLGSQTIVAYLVLGRFSGDLATATHLGSLVTIGALVEILALVALRLPPTLRYQRAAVAAALASLADYATTPAESSAMGALAAIDEAQRLLSPRSLFGRSDDRDLRAVLDQARRARLDFTTLAGLRARLGADAAAQVAIDAALVALARGVTELALTVRDPRVATTWRQHALEVRERLTEIRSDRSSADDPVLVEQACARLDALAGQLRSIGHLVERESDAAVRGAWRIDLDWRRHGGWRIGESLRRVRDHLSWQSSATRHTIRLVVAMLVATALWHWWGLPRGYWVPYAVALILKPDYSTLLRRGLGRVLGTMLGASLAAVVVAEMHPNDVATGVLVGLVAWAAYSVWPASFAVSIGLVTAVVLLFLSVSVTNDVSTALDRLLDVALGAVISAATYLIWPSSPLSDVRQNQSSMFDALGRYLDLVLATLAGEQVAAKAVSGASRAAHFRYADAEASVGRALEEPGATRSDPAVENAVLTSGLRVLRATHALRFESERGVRVSPTPEWMQLRRVLVETMVALANPEASERPAVSPVPRTAFRELAATSLFDPVASLGAHLDEVVNALDTAAHLLATS